MDSAHRFVRALGPAYQAVLDTATGKFTASGVDALVWGITLCVDGTDVIDRSLAEGFPDTTTNLLPEWERRLGLPVDTSRTTAERQAALLARCRSHIEPTVAAIEAALQEIDAGAVITVTGTAALPAISATITAAIYQSEQLRARLWSIARAAAPAYTLVTLVSA